jgi:hypothetical protein
MPAARGARVSRGTKAQLLEGPSPGEKSIDKCRAIRDSNVLTSLRLIVQGTMVFAVADAAVVNIDCVSPLSLGPCIAVMPLYP